MSKYRIIFRPSKYYTGMMYVPQKKFLWFWVDLNCFEEHFINSEAKYYGKRFEDIEEIILKLIERKQFLKTKQRVIKEYE